MASRSEEEIYSIMFKSLKHPVRRRILGLLNDKPLGFMELVALLGLSSSHLTYHLESLGELVAKTEAGEYCLSSFGKATVSAMKGVEEAPELANRRPKKLARKWKAAFAALMIAVLLLSGFGVYQYYTINQLAASQSSLEAENQQLLSWGIGAGTVADMLRSVVQLDTNRYKITLESNNLQYREDFDVAEEVLAYSFAGASGDFTVSLRFRENHLSRYQLTGGTTPQLLALVLATSVIAIVVNMIGFLIGPSILGIIFFAIVGALGHALNLSLSALSAYVHTSRLQYVEFFGKFFEGGGRLWKPLVLNTRYVNILYQSGTSFQRS
jgi:DNA-binding transcriptional ArsR family regulator